MKLIAISLLISSVTLAFPAPCIKKMLSIGQPEGEYFSDFDLLDRYATKDMRLRETTVCIDENRDL